MVVANDLKCSDPMTLSCGKISVSLVRPNFEYAAKPLILTYKVKLTKSSESKEGQPEPQVVLRSKSTRKD